MTSNHTDISVFQFTDAQQRIADKCKLSEIAHAPLSENEEPLGMFHSTSCTNVEPTVSPKSTRRVSTRPIFKTSPRNRKILPKTQLADSALIDLSPRVLALIASPRRASPEKGLDLSPKACDPTVFQPPILYESLTVSKDDLLDGCVGHSPRPQKTDREDKITRSSSKKSLGKGYSSRLRNRDMMGNEISVLDQADIGLRKLQRSDVFIETIQLLSKASTLRSDMYPMAKSQNMSCAGAKDMSRVQSAKRLSRVQSAKSIRSRPNSVEGTRIRTVGGFGWKSQGMPLTNFERAPLVKKDELVKVFGLTF